MTQEQIDQLNAEQQRNDRHPFTCITSGENCERTPSFKGVLKNSRDAGLLIATTDDWVCPCGAYKQPFNTSKMKNEFISYEQAVALKELGFDEPCFGRYNVPGDLILSGCYSDSPLISILVEQNDICESHTLAPTFSQAFRFFREKYGLIGWVDGKRVYRWCIESPIPTDGQLNLSPFRTYEEAENACIDKLIEICKQQQNETT